MGAASSHSCDFSVLRTVSSYSTGPSTDTSSLLEENLVSARFNYQKNTPTHIWTKYSIALFIKENLLKVFKDRFKV